MNEKPLDGKTLWLVGFGEEGPGLALTLEELREKLRSGEISPQALARPCGPPRPIAEIPELADALFGSDFYDGLFDSGAEEPAPSANSQEPAQEPERKTGPIDSSAPGFWDATPLTGEALQEARRKIAQAKAGGSSGSSAGPAPDAFKAASAEKPGQPKSGPGQPKEEPGQPKETVSSKDVAREAAHAATEMAKVRSRQIALAGKIKKIESMDKVAALAALGKALASDEDMDSFSREARPIAKEVRHVRDKIAEQEAVKGLAAIKAKGVAAMMRSRLSGAETRLGELYWDMGAEAPQRERFAAELEAIAECDRRIEALRAERKELDAEIERSSEANRQVKKHAASLWKQGFGG